MSRVAEATIQFATPLVWPRHRPVTLRQHRGYNPQFRANLSIADAVQCLKDALPLLGVQQATVHSNVEHMLSDRLRRSLKDDHGCCVSFRLHDAEYALCCDRWQLLAHNMYSVYLSVQAATNLAKWGVLDASAVLRMFRSDGTESAAPAQVAPTLTAATLPEWQQALGLGPTATVEDAHAIYRARAKLVGADEQALTRLNLAMDAARAALGGNPKSS